MVIDQRSSALQTGIKLLVVQILKQPNMNALALLGAIYILTVPTVYAQTKPELEWEKGSCGYLHKDKTLIAGICGVPNGDKAWTLSFTTPEGYRTPSDLSPGNLAVPGVVSMNCATGRYLVTKGTRKISTPLSDYKTMVEKVVSTWCAVAADGFVSEEGDFGNPKD